MTKEKLIERLEEIAELNGDIEISHTKADDLIIEFINDPEIKKAYDLIKKYYA